MEYMDEDEINLQNTENENNDKLEEFPVQNIYKKRRTNVGPWLNKEEFNNVYLWLFGPESCRETKLKACKKMTVWKLRSLNLTSASILSTLTVVEVQLKDESTKSINDLQLLYAGAFTRFLNYMCSTGHTAGRIKSMYQIAMDIGIDPFIVDLRHLCSHGRIMPSIDVLRNASDSCLNWIKQYYWEHEFANQVNVDAKNVRQKDITQFDEMVSELFQIYDSSILIEYKGCKQLNQARKFLSEENYNILKKYCNINEIIDINQIRDFIIKDLKKLIIRESTFKNLAPVVIEAFGKMVSIFKIPGTLCESKNDIQKVIRTNRDLFKSIAMYGFIERLFDELMYISENVSEQTYKRKGASFWANEIVLGFIAFNTFKNFCKKEKEKDINFKIQSKQVNNDGLSKKIKSIYRKLGFDSNSIIIFGDHWKRPWSLSFSENYIEERLKNICDHTKNIVKSCLNLVYPPLSDSKKIKLQEIIDIYSFNPSENEEISTNEDENLNITNSSKEIYCLEEDIFNKYIDTDMINLVSTEQNKLFGIWSTVEDDQDWNLCALGRLPWQ